MSIRKQQNKYWRTGFGMGVIEGRKEGAKNELEKQFYFLEEQINFSGKKLKHAELMGNNKRQSNSMVRIKAMRELQNKITERLKELE